MKQRTRKLLALNLAIVLVLSLLPVTAFAKAVNLGETFKLVKGEDFTFTPNKTSAYTLSITNPSSARASCGWLEFYDENGVSAADYSIPDGTVSNLYKTSVLEEGKTYTIGLAERSYIDDYSTLKIEEMEVKTLTVGESKSFSVYMRRL